MSKNKKIFSLLLFSFIALLLAGKGVYAGSDPVVLVNDMEDIYSSGGEGSAIFDKTTNTLTLDGYNGKSIAFGYFLDGETINIIVKGENVIDGGIGNTSGNGLAVYSDAIVNISGEEGSKLSILNYYNATYIYDGEFNVNDMDIDIKNIDYCGVYNANGVLNINDSTMVSDNVGYPIASDGDDINIINLELDAINTQDDVIYGDADVLIEDSNIIDEEGVNGSFLFADKKLTIKNSVVRVDNKGLGITALGEILFEDSDIDILTDGTCIDSNGKITINGKSLHVKSNYQPVISIFNMVDDDPNNYIILGEGVRILEEGLKIVKTSFFENYIYSISGEEVLESYDDPEEAMSVGAKEVTIVRDDRIIFDANGGSGTMKVIYGEGKITLPKNGFTAPAGKQFKGWSLSKDGEIIDSVDLNSDITLYAIWEDISLKNPETADSILFYVVSSFVSLIGIGLYRIKKINY